MIATASEHGQPEVAASTEVVSAGDAIPTIWGLDPVRLHDHFWASRGVFVARLGGSSEVPVDAELYLLADAQTLAIFRLAPLIDALSWVAPEIMFLRVQGRVERDYRESVEFDSDGQFARFRRVYSRISHRPVRMAITREWRIAAAWQGAGNTGDAWRQLRRQARQKRTEAASIRGRLYDRQCETDLAQFVSDLVELWDHPRTTIDGVRMISPGVWAYREAVVDERVTVVGRAWIGAGRKVDPGATVLGPAVLWDDPAARPRTPQVQWSELEQSPPLFCAVSRPAVRPNGPLGKRLFDVICSLFALLFTLPLYPLIMLLIWIEDGRPFFYIHRRQTLNGREFPCIKFRSMRRDAHKMKLNLTNANQADGPQFFIAEDPRQTRIGRIIRKLHIDEWPQFINILLGDMSLVGPRPSPHSENQFNPAWRDARLSVRAGITGLWQVRRTRKPGLDFQEWIRYDLEYVRNASWRMDLSILLRTVWLLIGASKR